MTWLTWQLFWHFAAGVLTGCGVGILLGIAYLIRTKERPW